MASQNRKKGRGEQPVSQHPLFPGLVALWFGALFGLGSLAIRPSLLESMVLASGIDTVVPAAAPPLGITARILVALAMAAIGGIAGSMIAHRIARPRPEPQQHRRQATPVSTRIEARRPISAHEELGERIVPATIGAMVGGERRNIAEEDHAYDCGPEFAPLPEQSDALLDLGAVAGTRAEVTPVIVAPSVAPAAPIAAAPDRRPFALPMAWETDVPEPAPAPVLPQMASPEAASVIDEPVLELPRLQTRLPEPAPTAAPANAETPAAEPGEAPQVTVAITVANIGFPLPEGEAAERLVRTDLESLNPMELIERLALSLLKRRDQTSAMAVAASLAAANEPAVAREPVARPVYRFGQPGMTEAAIAASAPEPAPMSLPSAMRPISFGDDHIDDNDLLPAIPPRHIAMPPLPVPAGPAPVAAEAAEAQVIEEGGEAPEENYSSLLDLDRQAQPQSSFVRVDEPEGKPAMIEPMVVFPGQAAQAFAAPAASAPAAHQMTPAPFTQPAAHFEGPVPLRRFDAPGTAQAAAPVAGTTPASGQDPAETQQALRTALAALQRMSGAA